MSKFFKSKELSIDKVPKIIISYDRISINLATFSVATCRCSLLSGVRNFCSLGGNLQCLLLSYLIGFFYMSSATLLCIAFGILSSCQLYSLSAAVRSGNARR